MSESLRDQLAANYDKITGDTPETPETPVTPEAPAEGVVADGVIGETQEQKAGRTAGRARDEKGRLLPGPAVKEPPQATQQATEAAPVVARPPRPSSWKKDYWDHWEKLDPKLAEYINQREGEYAKGVSTYKQEWEKAKPFIDAVAPFQQELQQYGIDPAQQIARYFQIHKTFANGSPQEKLSAFMRLANEYQVPVQQMFVQGQDGRIYFNDQLQQAQQQQQGQQQQPQDVRKLVQEALTEQTMTQQIAAMRADTKGYPHFESLREEMAGLLQAGLAQDLQSAYTKALRMHDDLFAQEQEAKRKADEAERQEQQRKAVAAARQNQVSPKSATPASAGKGQAKGLRAALESAYDEHASGRV
jgi:hypothetical protein